MRSFFVSLILGAIALPFFNYEGKVSAQIEGVSASFQQCLDRGVYYPYKNRIETQEILQKFEAEDGT